MTPATTVATITSMNGEATVLPAPGAHSRLAAEWMDRESPFGQRLVPQAMGVGPDPGLCAMKRRCSNLARQVAVLREKGRTPRVCLYALTAHTGEVPTRSLGEVRAFAVREGWLVGARQIITDRTGPARPTVRSGWSRVRRNVRSGYADGVVALAQSAITPRRDEYESQLQWFEDHFGFIALVYPEIPEEQR
ncbi:hypothetical protein [Streptomyces iconiensis]|uniref:Resolvase/invertase-type recombinase catalytic domain-containing protein n=1 Tax=Streptomyces iconiensis TaxID=1384038 RepID=A0ABT7A6N4_9ACTN|nr:hypothetical protein [Streptomyces iconiensis]MDJ1136288.1 hypothetical protein [Streptomyces iconiensis]